MHMKDKINTYVNNIKKLFNKDITEQVTKYRIPLIGGVVVILLACISIFVTYAFYQVEAVTPIVGGSTGDIADIELRVMVEDRIDGVENIDNENYGSAIKGEYVLYPYIPEAGYEYNAAKSYCTNGSVINYDPNTFDADITAYGHDVCYMYFDSTANLDITLRVHAENVDATTGEGTGKYTILETTTMPSIGYELNQEKTTCTSNATVSYIAADNLFSVEATGKAECDVYMDALNVDIALKIFLQDKVGSPKYYESDAIPNNYYYELNNEKSSCTGTSTLSVENQRVVVAATSRTSCVAYLDVASGPILESMEVLESNDNTTINLNTSNVGTNAAMYYYSSDGGDTFVSSTSPSYTFNTGRDQNNNYKAYYTDFDGKTSAIFDTNNYKYVGLYDYSNRVQTLTVPKTGYYLLEVWGAQGGGAQNYIGGYGGYSKGIVQLNQGDILYVVTGGQGGSNCVSSNCSGGYNGGGNGGYYSADSQNYQSGGGGATHIATVTGLLVDLENSKEAILLVAGGGSGAYYHSNGADYSVNGSSGGGIQGNSGTVCSYGVLAAGGGSQMAGGSAGYRGSAGQFGKGGNGISGSASAGASGGGGGYYGGGAAGHSGAGGGSGYIGNPILLSSSEITKSMYCYNCLQSGGVDTLTYSVTNASTTAISNTAKQGNGYAKVTYIGESLE